MRLKQSNDGRIHPTDGGPNDHHPRPTSVSINNTSQSLSPGTDYNLDISLPDSGAVITGFVFYGKLIQRVNTIEKGGG